MRCRTQASGAAISTAAKVSFTLAGSNNAVGLDGSGDGLVIGSGAGNFVYAMGEAISTAANVSFDLQGSNNAVGLDGSGDGLVVGSGSGNFVYATGEAIATAANVSFDLQGSNNAVGLDGSGDGLVIGSGSGNTVYASGEAIATAANVSFDLQGSNNTVGLDGSGDDLTISGTGNTVYGSNIGLTVGANSSVGVVGTGDAITATGPATVTVWDTPTGGAAIDQFFPTSYPSSLYPSGAELLITQFTASDALDYTVAYYQNGEAELTNFRPVPSNETSETLVVNDPAGTSGVKVSIYEVNYTNGTSSAVFSFSNGIVSAGTFSGPNLTGVQKSSSSKLSAPSPAAYYSSEGVPDSFTGSPESLGYDTYEILGDSSIADDAVAAPALSAASASPTSSTTASSIIAPVTTASSLATLMQDLTANADLLPAPGVPASSSSPSLSSSPAASALYQMHTPPPLVLFHSSTPWL